MAQTKAEKIARTIRGSVTFTEHIQAFRQTSHAGILERGAS